MLSVEAVSKQYSHKKSKKHPPLIAVYDVSFRLKEREVFAIIGESGSGKSTLAELIAGLQTPTTGHIKWDYPLHENTDGKRSKLPLGPLDVQIIFQNPDRSLNPYWKVCDLIAEPLVLNGWQKDAAYERVQELASLVKLPKHLLQYYPAACSGGQKQRIAIARALALAPKLLIADEITSALDPSIEADILDLLQSLKEDEGLSILYITHRIETVVGFADRAAVMYRGSFVEQGKLSDIVENPNSEYTKALLQAAIFPVMKQQQ